MENAIRHSIKTFGLSSTGFGRAEFDTRVRQLMAGDQLIASLIDCMLRARQAYVRLHEVVLAIVRQDELCRRFVRVPGAGPISALSWPANEDQLHAPLSH
jgi:transposase